MQREQIKYLSSYVLILCGVKRHTQKYFSYTLVASFIHIYLGQTEQISDNFLARLILKQHCNISRKLYSLVYICVTQMI